MDLKARNLSVGNLKKGLGNDDSLKSISSKGWLKLFHEQKHDPN